MNANKITALLLSSCLMLAGPVAFAADTMSKDGMAKPMKKDDAMAKPAMPKDGMMKPDTMMKPEPTMKSDSMTKPAPMKDDMKK